MTKHPLTATLNHPLTALVGPCLSVTLAAFGISVAAVTLPELAMEFSGARLDTTFVVSIYVLATTVLIVPAGRAGDLFGKRSILIAGICVYLVGAILAFFAPSLSLLIAGRLVQGAGATAMLAMPLALVRDIAPTGRIGRWMGVMGTMSAIGTASGPALGGAITAGLGWRYVYLLQIPLALIAFILCLVFLSDKKRHGERPSFDLAGAATLAVFLVALAACISGLAAGLTPTHALLFMLALCALAGFLFIESRAASPIIPLSAFRSRHLTLSLAMNAAVSLIMMGVLVIGPFFLKLGLGLTTSQMGLAMAVGPISSALSGIPAGRITERQGPGRAVVFGSVMVTAGAAGMAGLPQVFGLWGFVVAFILLAPGYQLFLAALNTSVIEGATESDLGVISGLLNLSRNFGFIIGASAMSTVFWALVSINGNPQPDPHSVQYAMTGTFFFASVLAAAVAWIAVRAHRLQPISQAA